ncbi:MAG: hypothetical protein ACOX3W_09645 [Christensenellaceae bacterium]|jgi:hypothetical protein
MRWWQFVLFLILVLGLGVLLLYVDVTTDAQISMAYTGIEKRLVLLNFATAFFALVAGGVFVLHQLLDLKKGFIAVKKIYFLYAGILLVLSLSKSIGVLLLPNSVLFAYIILTPLYESIFAFAAGILLVKAFDKKEPKVKVTIVEEITEISYEM